jgi:hypothetical protein
VSWWPPDKEKRIDIGCLVGIHMVPNPAFVALTTAISEAEIDRKMASFRQTMTDEQISETVGHFSEAMPSASNTCGLRPEAGQPARLDALDAALGAASLQRATIPSPQFPCSTRGRPPIAPN